MRRLAAAFTLTELLVVVVVVALLIAIRVPVLTRAGQPVQLAQCLSNCRQLGAATLLYRSDSHDAYPFGQRVTSGAYMLDPTGWPMQLLPYIGGSSNTQPKVFLCPSETTVAETWPIQLHYQANRMLMSDAGTTLTAIPGAQVRNPAIYWLFIGKGPWDFASVSPGGLSNPFLAGWNLPPGFPQFRRHSGGTAATAADGHCDWLRTPPYRPGQPSPISFGELGDCANGQNPPSAWSDDQRSVKLYSRYSTRGF